MSAVPALVLLPLAQDLRHQQSPCLQILLFSVPCCLHVTVLLRALFAHVVGREAASSLACLCRMLTCWSRRDVDQHVNSVYLLNYPLTALCCKIHHRHDSYRIQGEQPKVLFQHFAEAMQVSPGPFFGVCGVCQHQCEAVCHQELMTANLASECVTKTVV